jgi:hypothetical protein
MSLAECAAHLPIAGADKERTVRRLIRRHKVEFTKVGRAVGLTKVQLEALIEAMKRCDAKTRTRRQKVSTSGATNGMLTRSSGSERPASGLERLRAFRAQTSTRQPPGSVVEFPR